MSPAIPPPPRIDRREPITLLDTRCVPYDDDTWRGDTWRGDAPGLRIHVAHIAPAWSATVVWTRTERAEATDGSPLSFVAHTCFIAHTIDAIAESLEALDARLRALALLHLPSMGSEPREVTWRPSERDFLVESRTDEPLVVVRPRERQGEAGRADAEALARAIARIR